MDTDDSQKYQRTQHKDAVKFFDYGFSIVLGYKSYLGKIDRRLSAYPSSGY